MSRNKYGNRHGGSGTRLYKIWEKMKARCRDENNNRYKWYGAKGITVCKAWVDDFDAFRTWAYDYGYTEEMTIDRKESSKNYEPNNCQWLTLSENTSRSTMRSNSDRTNIKIDDTMASEVIEAISGGYISQAEASRELGVHVNTIWKLMDNFKKEAA